MSSQLSQEENNSPGLSQLPEHVFKDMQRIMGLLSNHSCSVELQQDVESIVNHLHDHFSNVVHVAEQEQAEEVALKEEISELKSSLEGQIAKKPEKVDYVSGETKNASTSSGASSVIGNVIRQDPALLHEDMQFLSDLVFVLGSASVFGACAVAIQVPMIIGFIVGGVVVGPSGLGLVVQVHRIDTLAEVGAALVFFAQGLQFHPSEPMKHLKLSLWALALQILGIGSMFCLIQSFFNGLEFSSYSEAMLLGLSASLTSSTVVHHLATDYHLKHGAFHQLVGAMLFPQDLLMGLFLCFPEAMKTGFLGIFVIGRQFAYAIVLVSAFVYVSAHIVPRIAKFFLPQEAPHLNLLSCLSICLGGAFLTDWLDLSAEFGAFFAGLALTTTETHKDTFVRIESAKNLFSTVLFASIGMMISPSFVWSNFQLILISVILMLLVKITFFFFLLRIFKNSISVSLITAIGMSQIAEFSMILAGKGYLAGLVIRRNYLIFLTVTVMSLLLNPLLFKYVVSTRWMEKHRASKVISMSVSHQKLSSMEYI